MKCSNCSFLAPYTSKAKFQEPGVIEVAGRGAATARGGACEVFGAAAGGGEAGTGFAASVAGPTNAAVWAGVKPRTAVASAWGPSRSLHSAEKAKTAR